MSDKEQPTDLAGSVASTGAEAPAGGEAHPPGPSSEPTSAPFDLPKALSEEEADELALSQLILDKRRWRLRAEKAEARIAELEAQQKRDARGEDAEYRARVRCESKLAAANTLLERVHVEVDFRAHATLLAAIRAHLAGQPAAPTRTCVNPRCAMYGRSDCPMHAAPRQNRFERRLERTAELPVSVMASSVMPEAPVTGCVDCGANTLEPHRAGCAAPTRTGCGFGLCGTVTECVDCGRAPGQSPRKVVPTHTDAEQAVLDTFSSISEETLRYYLEETDCLCGGLPALLRTELARRGLK